MHVDHEKLCSGYLAMSLKLTEEDLAQELGDLPVSLSSHLILVRSFNFSRSGTEEAEQISKVSNPVVEQE